MQICMTYNYPSVRLILPETMTLAAKIFLLGLFAVKSINQHYLISPFNLFYLLWQ